MSASPLGLFLAVLSAVFNGSFAAFSKFKSATLVHPFVFNLYLSVGVFCSSLLVLPTTPAGHRYGKSIDSSAPGSSSLEMPVGMLSQ